MYNVYTKLKNLGVVQWQNICLPSRGHGFDSRYRVQICRCGGIGRHPGLKIPCHKKRDPVRVRPAVPRVRRQALKVTKTIGSPNIGTLGGPTPYQGCEIHRDYVRLELRTELFYIKCGCSSIGQSTCLPSRVLRVRVPLSAPKGKAKASPDYKKLKVH